jgi:hypothetical protein
VIRPVTVTAEQLAAIVEFSVAAERDGASPLGATGRLCRVLGPEPTVILACSELAGLRMRMEPRGHRHSPLWYCALALHTEIAGQPLILIVQALAQACVASGARLDVAPTHLSGAIGDRPSHDRACAAVRNLLWATAFVEGHAAAALCDRLMAFERRLGREQPAQRGAA